MTMEEYCKQLERRVAELERENAELRAQLGLSDTKAAATVPPAEVENSPSATVHKYSSPNEKIQLFCSLFRGREDVFAKRWYSTKTEKVDILRSVPTNGVREFVSSRREVAQNVKTVNWCR